MGQILTIAINWTARLALLHSETLLPQPTRTVTIALRQLSGEKPGVFLIAASTEAAGREESSLLAAQPTSRGDDIVIQLITEAHELQT